MKIVASAFEVGHAQANGLHYIVETHTWDTGEVSTLEYGPLPIDTDCQAIADKRARQLEADRVTQAAERAEKVAADEKVAAVMDAAVKAGTLTTDDMQRAGIVVELPAKARVR